MSVRSNSCRGIEVGKSSLAICNCFVVQFQNPLRCHFLTRGHDFTFPLALVLERKAAPLFTLPCRVTLVGGALTFTWRVYETKGATFICILRA